MLVGHVPRFGHGRSNLDGVTQHMDVLCSFGLKGQKVHLAPALVSCRQTGIDRYIARPHGRDHVQNIGFNTVIELELQGVGGSVYVLQRVLGAVFQNAFVALCPCLFKQWAFGASLASRISTLLFGLALLK